MEKVLITGVAGFIGANFAIKLLKSDKEIQVIGIDNLNDYYDVDLKDYEGIMYIDEDDYNEENAVEQKQCGFEIAIFKDYHKKYRIYKSYFEIEKPEEELDDFAFQMTNVFQNWDQLPECLVCQTKFIDKYLGNVITSNQFVITKEWFKYMINDYGKPRIELSEKQEKLNNIYSIGYGALLICLEDNITKEIANEIIELKSDNITRDVFKESGFKSDADKTNIKENLRINNINEFITL